MKMLHLRNHLRLALAVLLYFLAGSRSGQRGKTRVLVFHHLDQPDRFRAIILHLMKNYRFIGFEDYLAGRKAPDRINLILALDDGYRSWHRTGLPLFREFGIKPLLFVNSGFIDLPDAAAMSYCREVITTWPEPALTWDELQELEKAGAETGGHTRGHIRLTDTDHSTALADISADRAAISHKLGREIRTFAYPFGLHDIGSAALVAQAGYQYAFTSDSGFLEDSPGPLLLNRSNTGLRSPLVACAIAEGWADVVSAIIRRIKGRSSPSWAPD